MLRSIFMQLFRLQAKKLAFYLHKHLDYYKLTVFLLLKIMKKAYMENTVIILNLERH